LRGFAEGRNPGRVLFHHEFRSFLEREDGVEAVICNLDTNEEFIVRARYIIGADAGKTLAPALGVEMVGPTNLGDYVMVYVRADLSDYIPDDRAVMRAIIH